VSLRVKAVVTARSIAAVLAAAGTVGTGAQQAGLWETAPSRLLWTCIVLPGAVAVGEQVRLIRAERKAGPAAQRQEAIDRALNDALLTIADITGYSNWAVGVTAWQVRSRGLRLTKRGLSRPERLERLSRRRFTDRPAPSQMEWTKGKGVIGQCWASDRELHKDLREACEKYPGGDITPERFPKISEKLRMGMSLEEFRKMIGKYGEVLAVPIKNKDGRTLGVLAVDVPIEECDDNGSAQLGRVEVLHVAATTAAVVARVIEGD
jgi:hypothetical protein